MSLETPHIHLRIRRVAPNPIEVEAGSNREAFIPIKGSLPDIIPIFPYRVGVQNTMEPSHFDAVQGRRYHKLM